MPAKMEGGAQCAGKAALGLALAVSFKAPPINSITVPFAYLYNFPPFPSE